MTNIKNTWKGIKLIFSSNTKESESPKIILNNSKDICQQKIDD